MEHSRGRLCHIGVRSNPNQFRLLELRGQIRPVRLHWFPRLASTNDHAARLRRRGDLFAPAIVLTGKQTCGRGRGANTWHSQRGSLTVTFVLPADERLAAHQVPLIAGLAVRDAVADLTSQPAIQLKWPNDIVYRGRKLGGLLCERIANADLIGIGLNVNLNPGKAPKNLRDRIASMDQIARHPIDLTDALVALASHLRLTFARAQEQPFAALLGDYDAHHALLGKHVRVIDSGGEALQGRCEGLDRVGRLLLRFRGVLHRLVSGQVQVR